jgi:HAD superfamily hydrolase (TIGR01484 family)
MSKDMSGSTRESLKKLPQPWEQCPLLDLSQVLGVCLDIDDTLSTSGKLTAEAFAALWELKEKGFAVVPVTGRPAGWCDHFARFWPVDAVVGENGAFTFFMDKNIRKRINTPSFGNSREKLTVLGTKIQARFPGVQWASDQMYREFDLAIDICEDVRPWTQEKIDELLEMCQQEGAHAKLSSIHVNVWFGAYDKQKGFDYWLEQGSPGWNGKTLNKNQWLYIGDSPNDEPMFSCFSYSVGVANLNKYIHRLKHPPLWITTSESGQGFTEMVQRLILARDVLNEKK